MVEPPTSSPGRGFGQPHRFRGLLHRLLQFADQGFTRMEFLRLAGGFLKEFSTADTVEILIDESGKPTHCRTTQVGGVSRIECTVPALHEQSSAEVPVSSLSEIMEGILRGRLAPASPFSTRSGSFWTGDSTRPVLFWDRGKGGSSPRSIVIGGDYSSLALLAIPVDEETKGVLLLGSLGRDFFAKEDIHFFEAVAEALGVAIAYQAAQWALRERVKELTCLYGIAQVAQQTNLSLEESLREIAGVLPPGWQYPEITSARITVDGREFATPDFRPSPFLQSAGIFIHGRRRGSVEVAYSQPMPEFQEGPFLKEERNLIDEVARQVGFLIDHREDEEERRRLRERLGEPDPAFPPEGLP